MVGRSTAEVASVTDRAPEVGGVPRVEVFRALGDPTRLAVLDLLAVHGSRCHCELEAQLEVPANRLSFHLKVLRDVGLVGVVRRGRRSHYHLEPGALDLLRAALPAPHQPDPTATTDSACRTGDLEATR
jgi:ArsR family transcriptional regulator, arsenate/arsenite/antimonite-responsive transcriptional repressor